MIKQFTSLLLLLSSLNVFAEDVIITSDAPQTPSNNIPSSGPIVNLGSPPQDTFFSFGSKTPTTSSGLGNSPSPFSAGITSNLFSYEAVISSPDDTDNNGNNNTNVILSAGVETIMPNGFAYHGGFSFVVQDSFETALNFGGRFYSGAPIFSNGISAYSYIGAGMILINSSTFYPEVGIRILPSQTIRMDFFFKAYNSSSKDLDGYAMLGLGLSF